MVTRKDLYGQPWAAREYLIVLAHYFKSNGEAPPVESAEVQALAERLGRTPASILMRMENFASLDTSVTRKGLINSGPECQRIFDDWKDRRSELFTIAEYLEQEMSPPLQASIF